MNLSVCLGSKFTMTRHAQRGSVMVFWVTMTIDKIIYLYIEGNLKIMLYKDKKTPDNNKP